MKTEVSAAPIGVFDSGMGGLTVLRALHKRLPHERYLYLGDNARLPYGTKSARTVIRYAEQAAETLVERGVKALIIACNTASGVALHELQTRFASIPVIGVIEPGAIAAAAAERRNVIVLATESTVAAGAYQRALLAQNNQLKVRARSCPLWVTLAEMGPQPPAFTEQILRAGVCGLDALESTTFVLGCTHFPVFRSQLEDLLPTSIVVDSAETTATAVHEILKAQNMLNAQDAGAIEFLATDGGERFARVGQYFLGRQIDHVSVVDL